WTRENLGACGYGDVGAVVGATHPVELALLREDLPEAIILVPGFGAQGATATDTAPAFRADGTGAVINSARAILFPSTPATTAWEAAIETAAKDTIAALSTVTPMARLAINEP